MIFVQNLDEYYVTVTKGDKILHDAACTCVSRNLSQCSKVGQKITFPFPRENKVVACCIQATGPSVYGHPVIGPRADGIVLFTEYLIYRS